LKSHLPHGSLIFEPLAAREGEPLGLLVLMRNEPGEFRADQLDMARLFSARAAATIEMAQLYQQTRRDADDKATLLRELNHRVKNNLASIVSLLSMNQPALDAEARQWLDRVVERIVAMAHVHGPFSGIQEKGRDGWLATGPGGKRVTVEELVQQTVLSVSVAKGPGVNVRLELAEGTALRADRAVSLALAMHELCYNGLVHGLSAGGTLTIRSRRSNGDLALEVEDDAGNGRPASEPIEHEIAGRSGIGLSLVRGLVGRELRGQFSLSPGAGGAVARVQFPLLAEEVKEGR
jgi:two-component sensor histidine kinase